MPTLKLSLETDYRDYFDHLFYPQTFHPESIPFKRFLQHPTNLTRKQAFQLFTDHYLPTPPHGTPQQLTQYLTPQQQVIVYTDPKAHVGEGKIRVSLDNALVNYPDHFTSQYLQADPHPKFPNLTSSYRQLAIGDYSCWLCYASDHPWCSNVSDNIQEILFLHELPERDPYLPHYPLYAIDYVKHNHTLYAVDFNNAPGIKWAMQDILSATQVYDHLADFIRKRDNL